MQIDATMLEHMMEPRNYGSMDDADSEGIGKNPQNGEKVAIYMQIEPHELAENALIKAIRFQAIGCTTTIVSGSLLTEEAKGGSLARTRELIEATHRLLENVPPEDAACTYLVTAAMEAAIETYEARRENCDHPPITKILTLSCAPQEEL
jgi:nitrogen fixation protein NifU and related proteins